MTGHEYPNVELIGIRDIDTRLLEDPIAPPTPDHHFLYDEEVDTPYFQLYEQISSLLRSDAFPNLRFVRDLSRKSHEMRTVQPQPRVLQFWTKVVAACASRGRAVWLEDWSGVNITHRALRRAAFLQDRA